MDHQMYRISSSAGEWVVEHDNLTIRTSSQASAIELATAAAKYDHRLGQSAQVVLSLAQGEWKTIWLSEDDVRARDGHSKPRRATTN